MPYTGWQVALPPDSTDHTGAAQYGPVDVAVASATLSRSDKIVFNGSVMDTQDAIWYEAEQRSIGVGAAEPSASLSSSSVAVPSFPTAPSRQLERMDSEQALNCFLHGSLPGTVPDGGNT